MRATDTLANTMPPAWPMLGCPDSSSMCAGLEALIMDVGILRQEMRLLRGDVELLINMVRRLGQHAGIELDRGPHGR